MGWLDFLGKKEVEKAESDAEEKKGGSKRGR